MVMPSFLPDPDQRLDAQLARVGATNQYIEISPARSIVETLSGQSNAEEVARNLVASGFQGCWVVAMGTNDTANIYAVSTVGRMARIDQMMSVVGDQPVDRKSTRLNSSHANISYAVFCLKKKHTYEVKYLHFL